MGQPTVSTVSDPSDCLLHSFARVHEAWFRTSVIKRRYEISEYIGGFKQTQGTETSQYLEERTSTETPLVVASERGPGQWPEGKNGKDLERSAIVGDSPVPIESP